MTKEEFMQRKDYYEYKLGTKEPIYDCPCCGQGVYRDISVMYAVYPPKYRYFCLNCGHRDFI